MQALFSKDMQFLHLPDSGVSIKLPRYCAVIPGTPPEASLPLDTSQFNPCPHPGHTHVGQPLKVTGANKVFFRMGGICIYWVGIKARSAIDRCAWHCPLLVHVHGNQSESTLGFRAGMASNTRKDKTKRLKSGCVTAATWVYLPTYRYVDVVLTLGLGCSDTHRIFWLAVLSVLFGRRCTHPHLEWIAVAIRG